MDGPFKRSGGRRPSDQGAGDPSDQGAGDPSDQGADPPTYWSNTLKFPGVQKPDLVTSPVSMVAGTAWG
jgi:hypothetical protein